MGVIPHGPDLTFGCPLRERPATSELSKACPEEAQGGPRVPLGDPRVPRSSQVDPKGCPADAQAGQKAPRRLPGAAQGTPKQTNRHLNASPGRPKDRPSRPTKKHRKNKGGNQPKSTEGWHEFMKPMISHYVFSTFLGTSHAVC